MLQSFRRAAFIGGRKFIINVIKKCGGIKMAFSLGGFLMEIAMSAKTGRWKSDKKNKREPFNKFLFAAAVRGDTPGVKQLIAAGVNPNGATKNGTTALMLAAIRNKTEIAKILLEAKANPNAENNNNWTALKLAKKHGHSEIIRLLKSAGAKK